VSWWSNKRQMFLRRELEWVRKSPKARTTKSQSRLDRYYEVEGKQAFEVEKDVELIIPPPPQLGNRIVDLDNVGMELGGRWLFHDVATHVRSGHAHRRVRPERPGQDDAPEDHHGRHRAHRRHCERSGSSRDLIMSIRGG